MTLPAGQLWAGSEERSAVSVEYIKDPKSLLCNPEVAHRWPLILWSIIPVAGIESGASYRARRKGKCG